MTDCPICQRGEPEGIIGEASVTWYTTSSPAPMLGYVCVVSKRHVVEPFELQGTERHTFWDETLRAAEAVQAVFQPNKINYEIHGNTIPHLHVHVFPRYPGDPFVGGPIDPRRASVDWPPEALNRLRESLM